MKNITKNVTQLTFLIVACVFTVSNAHAFQLTSKPSPYNGFYTGINAGSMSTNVNMTVDANATFVNYFARNNQLALSQQNRITQTQGGGSFFVGGGSLVGCSNFFLGAEFFVNEYSRQSSINNANFHLGPPDQDADEQDLVDATKAKLNSTETGIDIRPGYVFWNTLAYARVGVAFNRLSLNNDDRFTFTYTFLDPDVITNSTLSTSKTRNVSGLRLGFGLESFVNKHLSLTADYVYTSYGKISNFSQANVTTNTEPGAFTGDGPQTVVNGLTNDSSANFDTQTFSLGIKYYFNC